MLTTEAPVPAVTINASLDTRGALHTGSRRQAVDNPTRDILRIIREVRHRHAGVIDELAKDSDKRDAVINVALVRVMNERNDLDAEIAERLVRRTVDAQFAGIVR